MMAYHNDALLATPDEWGLLQNSVAVYGRGGYFPPYGWDATFTVEGKVYQGYGWFINTGVVHFVIKHRNLPRAEDHTRW